MVSTAVTDVDAISDACAPPWAGVALHIVTTLYRDNDPTEHDRQREKQRLLASVIGYYHAARHQQTPLVYGWIRTDTNGPVQVITSSPASTAAALIPPSADTTPVAAHLLTAKVGMLASWKRVGIIADGLPAAQTLSPGTASPAGLDDLFASWPQPFAWLLIATPASPEQAAGHIAVAAEAELTARAFTSNPTHTVSAEQHAARHKELRAGQTSGLWNVHLLAGGNDEAAAHAIAGILAAGLDLSGLPYTLAPATNTASFMQAWATHTEDTITGAASPQVASSALSTALVAVPSRELAGLAITARHTFDLAIPAHTSGVSLGDVLDRQLRPTQPLLLPPNMLTQHVFVAGATGTGKSTTIAHLLRQATSAGLPWLVIEPAKSEYQHRLADTNPVVIRPGAPDATAIGFNPLQPPDGFPLQTHADLIRSLFSAAFSATEPFPQILDAALTRAYHAAGWDLVLSQPLNPGAAPEWPTLEDLRHHALDVIAGAGYGPEVQADVTGFVNVRLGRLSHGTTGALFTARHRIDFAKLLRRNTILAIEDVGDENDQAFLMGAFLIALTGHLRTEKRHHSTGVRHLTVVEEAHRLLRRPEATSGVSTHAVNIFATMLAEIRAYGEGIIIADQIPAKLIPDTIKNTATKIIHSLPAQDDRDAVGAAMNLSPAQSEFLVSVSSGTAAVFSAGMDRPVLTRTPMPTPAGPARTATSPVVLAANVPLGCGVECANSPCTLRDHRSAETFLNDHPLVRIWADLSVVAHLLAVPAPMAGHTITQLLAGAGKQLGHHALGRAVSQSVHSRAEALARTHDHRLLAEHIFNDLASDTQQPCLAEEYSRWCHPSFALNPIRTQLLEALETEPVGGRHPATAQWERNLRLRIEGDTMAEQLEQITLLSNLLASKVDRIGALLLGTSSVIAAALRCQPHSPEWVPGLRNALSEMDLRHDWPATYLLQRYQPGLP